jgi:hypothetical protein
VVDDQLLWKNHEVPKIVPMKFLKLMMIMDWRIMGNFRTFAKSSDHRNAISRF